MFSKIIEILIIKYHKIDSGLLFCTFGFIFPLLHLLCRIFYVLEYEISFFPPMNMLFSLFIFCYMPTLCFFVFFHKKSSFFFIKIFKKCNFLFLIFCKMAKFERYFYNNIGFGVFLTISYFALYLYAISIGSFFELILVGSRLIICSYWAFKSFFERELFIRNSIYMEDLRFLSFFDQFSKIYEVLMSGKAEKSVFSGLYTIYLFCLYKKNKSVRLEVESVEKTCNEIFSSLEKICTEQDLQDLCMEKQRIFEMSNSKSPFFFCSVKSLWRYSSKM